MMVKLKKAQFYLVGFLLFTLPLVFYPANTSYGYTKTIYLIFFLSSLIAFWCLEIILDPEKKVRKNVFTIPLSIIFAGGLLSLVNSKNLPLSLSYLFTFALLGLFLHILSDMSLPADRKFKLFFAIVSGGFLVSVYALLQYFQLVGSPDLAAASENMIASMGNKNFVAEYLAISFPLLIASLLRSKFKLTKAYFGSILVSYSFTLLLILSWTSFLALFVSFLTFGILNKNLKNPDEDGIPKFALGGLSILAIVIIGLVITTILIPRPLEKSLEVFKRGRTVKEANESNNSDSLNDIPGVWPKVLSQSKYQSIRMRVFSWQLGREMFASHPFLGGGIGNYQLKFIPYKSQVLRGISKNYSFYLERSKRAHNDFVQLVAETGLLGLIGILAFFVSLFQLFSRGLSKKKTAKERLIIAGTVSALIGFCVIALFSFPFFRPESGILFFFSAGLLANCLDQNNPESQIGAIGEGESGRKRWLVPIAVVLASLLIFCVAFTCYKNIKGNYLLEKNRQVLERGYFSSGQLVRVKKGLKESKKLSLLDYRQNFYLGLVDMEEGQYEKAARNLEKSLNGPVTERKYLLLAISYYEQGKNDLAWDYVDKLLASDPHPNHKNRAFYLRARLFKLRGNLELAIEQIQHVIDQGRPLLVIDGYIAKAKFYLEEDEIQQAKKSYLNGKTKAEKMLKETERKLTQVLKQNDVSIYRVLYLRDQFKKFREKISEIRSELERL